jgi:hypothetical protein
MNKIHLKKSYRSHWKTGGHYKFEVVLYSGWPTIVLDGEVSQMPYAPVRSDRKLDRLYSCKYGT